MAKRDQKLIQLEAVLYNLPSYISIILKLKDRDQYCGTRFVVRKSSHRLSSLGFPNKKSSAFFTGLCTRDIVELAIFLGASLMVDG